MEQRRRRVSELRLRWEEAREDSGGPSTRRGPRPRRTRGGGQAGAALESRGDRQGWLCTHTCSHTAVGQPPPGQGRKHGVCYCPDHAFLPCKNTLKIPFKLDVELPALVLASCIYASIRVLLLKFMHAYIYI